MGDPGYGEMHCPGKGTYARCGLEAAKKGVLQARSRGQRQAVCLRVRHPRGAVSLTLTCLHLGRPKPLTGMMFREADLVQAPPVSGGRNPPRCVAVFSFQPEFSGRRGASRAAGDRRQLRDDPVLDDQVRAAHCQALETPPTGTVALLGIWTRWSVGSVEGEHICGVQSTTKARSWTSWSSAGGTQRRR